MTIRDRRSRWIKRGILPAAFVAVSGIGVAFAFVMPASADTFARGIGATPEEAIQDAADACEALSLHPGIIIEQKIRPEGTWQVIISCIEPPAD